jgi:hypothetical protein
MRDRIAAADVHARAEHAGAIGEQSVIAEHDKTRVDVVPRERETDVGADAGGLAGADDDDG